MTGWISLHRKIMDNPIYPNANMLKLWIHCLMKASHTERDQLIGNQIVKLKAGEFVTGRNSLAEEFNKGAKKDDIISPATLWRWLNKFEEWQMLNIKKTTKYSVVAITNWNEYQQHEHQVNNKWTADEQQMNNNCTSSEHQVNTNNNANNLNNTTTSTRANDPVDLIAERFCELRMIQEGKEVYPTVKDYEAITRIVARGMPLPQTIKLLEQCFTEYHQRDPNGAIKAFGYCEKYIGDHFERIQAAGDARHTAKTATDNVRPFKKKADGYEYDYGF